MKRNSENEMEQIRRGLEEFLEKEMQKMQEENTEKTSKEQLTEAQSMRNRYMEEEDAGKRFIEKRYGEESYVGKGTIESPYMEEDGDFEEEEFYMDQPEDWDAKKPQEYEGSRKTKDRRSYEAVKQTNRKVNSQEPVHKKKVVETDDRKVKNKKKKKKKSKLKRFLVTMLILALLLGSGLYYLVGKLYGKLNYEPIGTLVSEPMKEEGVVNILLIGNDSRENGADGRSDAMILLSISNQTKKIYMTSLLRDMYVDIPGHDGNRLNAAYSYGGPELLMETIEQNLGITVNRYARVNFEAFAHLVDAVGGIELDLSQQEKEYVNGYLVEYNMLLDRPQGTDNIDASAGGVVHLNGPQALAYTRNRDLGMDFGRTERQRKVLSGVIGKLPKALISNPKELLNGILPNLTTNLTKNECFRLSLMAGKLFTYDIEQNSIPREGTYNNASIRGMSVLEVDFEANKQYLRESIYGQTN